jgi:predicted HTH transcriptional regulator
VLRKAPIFTVDDPRWLRDVRALPISLAQKRALVAFVDREMANSDYVALNAVDRDTAYRDLADLAARGLVEVRGTSATTTYRVLRIAVPAPAVPLSVTPIEQLVTRMASAGQITNADVREIFGINREAAKYKLARWVTDGVLVREGTHRQARYRPGQSWPPH